jgi:hypothetical protein
VDREELIINIAMIEDEHRSRVVSFPQQDAFINDPAQFLAVQCTRRAGKTSGLAEKFVKTMQRYPGSLSRYIALTRDSAKDIMWGILQDLDDRDNLGAEFIESTLTMKLPNGARLRLFGADMQNFIRRLKGAKSPAVAIDEAQDFGPHITTLIDDVLTPTIIDYEDSWLAVAGTPGPVPRGAFYDITTQGHGDFSIHKWTLYQNPYLPDAQKFVDKLKERKKWQDDNPTYQREYQNKWVLDADSLLIKYDAKTNHYDHLPIAKWVYILGVDIGHRDADALAVIGWSESLPDIYLIEEQVTKEQDITELSNQIERMMAKYDISKIVMDEGALGKKIAEEIRRRKHIPVQPADKMRKVENVAFLNDYLRQGKFRAKRDSHFARDAELLQVDWDKTTPDRLVVKKGFHSDIVDAVLYAFKESPAFTFTKTDVGPARGTKEWYEQQVVEMEQSAIDHFEAEENAAKLFNYDDYSR